MKIQVVSDLHLEFPATEGFMKLENVGGETDLLVLAGDICTARNTERYRDFFKQCADLFPRTIYIPGNHEPYHGDIEEFHGHLRTMVAPHSNVHYLDHEFKSIGEYYVFGGTLWTDCNRGDPLTMNALQGGMNDYRIIKWKSRQHWKLRPSDTVEIHKAAMKKLRAHFDIGAHNANNYPNYKLKKTIMVTHHAPSPQSIHPKYAGDTRMNSGYYSDLREFMAEFSDQIPVWFHGHTHTGFDYDEQGIRVVCNPRGYIFETNGMSENSGFDPNKVVEI